MLVKNNNYKITKSGNIHSYQKIQWKCDKCGYVSECFYNSYKRMKHKDMCKSCQNKIGIIGTFSKNHIKFRKTNKKPWVEIKCSNCNKKINKRNKYILKNNFCSLSCFREFKYDERYGLFIKYVYNNIYDASYLIGVILGDGNVMTGGNKTMDINIYFDTRDEVSILNIENILKKYNISFRYRSISEHGCANRFVIPKEFFEKYNLSSLNGDKYKCQPYPSDKIVKNINYALGLINSDGYYFKRIIHGGGAIRFANTVKSIVESYKKCLYHNNIDFWEQTIKKIRYKTCMKVIISKKKYINDLINMSNFQIKKRHVVK